MLTLTKVPVQVTQTHLWKEDVLVLVEKQLAQPIYDKAGVDNLFRAV